MKIVLASESPRRKKILSQFDLDLICVPHLFDESSIEYQNDPAEYCQLISNGKATSISDKYSQIIIAADTIVVLDGHIMGKPRDKAQAKSMLMSLSGRRHQVLTGVTCIKDSEELHATFYDETIVEFYPLHEKQVDYYIEKYKPFDKSGSYGIQDYSSIFVKSIEGCFFNVVGLPISKLFQKGLIKFSLNTSDTNDNI